MPRLTKIYTKTGDDGMTGLGARRGIDKDASGTGLRTTVIPAAGAHREAR